MAAARVTGPRQDTGTEGGCKLLSQYWGQKRKSTTLTIQVSWETNWLAFINTITLVLQYLLMCMQLYFTFSGSTFTVKYSYVQGEMLFIPCSTYVMNPKESKTAPRWKLRPWRKQTEYLVQVVTVNHSASYTCTLQTYISNQINFLMICNFHCSISVFILQ